MSLSITFMIPPISGHDFQPIAETTYGTIGDDKIFNVSLTRELGSITQFSFTTIETTIFAYYNGYGQDIPFMNIIRPGKTLVIFKDNNVEVFYGRIYSVGRGVNGADTIKIICEDITGYLRESFIWYSNKYDDDEDAQYRANEGDSVADLLSAIIDNHNNYMELSYDLHIYSTYSTGNPSCEFAGVTGITNETLNSNLSLDGVSTLEALNDIFDDIGYEWDLSSLTGRQISLIAGPRLHATGGGTIATGKTLKSANKVECVRDMFSAILPLGGFGYNARRLSLSNDDFPISMAMGYPTYTIDDLKHSTTTDGERKVIYAVNPTLYARYGLRIKTIIYDEITADSKRDTDIAEARDTLVELAKIDAELLNTDIVTWEVQAVDLSAVGIGPNYIMYADYNIVDTINNISVTDVRLIKMDKNYDDPSKSNFSFELPTDV